MRQLFPARVEEVDPADVYGDLPTARGRPGVRLTMIASADGAAAVGGTSGGLGGAADRRIYLLLRSLADVILVGAGTVRAEGYGPPALPEELVAARRRRGQSALPRVAVVSRSCRLDWSSRLFGAAPPRPIVVTVAGAPAEGRARAAERAEVVLAGEEDVDLAGALAAMVPLGARSVVAEGGPTFNGHLAAAGLVDELCLTISPRLVGGGAPRILAGPPLPTSRELRLRSLCEEDGFLFLRLRP